jgi:hypothetical protein
MTQRQEAINKLLGALRQKAEKSGDDVYWGNLYWRVNRGGPHYGVYERYPITKDFPHNLDECAEDAGLEAASAKQHCDIAISHKGMICHAIFVDSYYKYENAYRRIIRIHDQAPDCSIWFVSSYEIVNGLGNNAFPGIQVHH